MGQTLIHRTDRKTFKFRVDGEIHLGCLDPRNAPESIQAYEVPPGASLDTRTLLGHFLLRRGDSLTVGPRGAAGPLRRLIRSLRRA